jgi:putative redox protein
MANSVNVTWGKNMKFIADVDGHQVILDAGESVGGKNEGPRPKSLMMVALAGCTGMDVISILNKMKVVVTFFNVRVEGETKEDHPKKFTKMNIIYEISGPEVEFEKVKKAVELSVEKYCGVNANYRDSMEMNYQIIIR